MSSALDSVRNGLIPMALETSIALGAISGRSITLIATASKLLLWTMIATSITATAIQIITIILPSVIVIFPFSPHVVLGVLGFTAIGSVLASIAIKRLSPEKELEANLHILKGELSDFDAKIDTKLPNILRSLAEKNEGIIKAIQQLDEKNKELVRVAHDMGQMLPAAAESLKQLQTIKEELFSRLEDLKEQVSTRSQLMVTIQEILTRFEQKNPYTKAVTRLEEISARISNIEVQRTQREALMQLIETSVKEGVERTASIDKVLSTYAGNAFESKDAFQSAKRATEALCGSLKEFIELLKKENEAVSPRSLNKGKDKT